MAFIPWRVKAYLSNHFPLAYHVAANLGAMGNSAAHWDRMLEETWDDPSRAWPTKTEIIASLTTRDANILDVACGTGSILRALSARGYSNLSALEISRYAVDRLNAGGINARRGVLPAIDFPDRSMDVVIASQVLEHVVRRHAFLKEIHRVLKPDGWTFIFVPNNCLGPIDEPEHVQIYTRESLRRILAKHFDVQKIESIRDANHEVPILFAQARAGSRAPPRAKN